MKKPIATVDAVREGKFFCTIRTDARCTGISGSLCCFDAADQKILCRVGSVDMMNPIHANPAFQPLIMEQGRLPHFSRDTDIETTTLDMIACVDTASMAIATRRSNPSSGTDIFPVAAEEISAFMGDKTHYFNAGTLPSDSSIPMSIVNRHFGDWDKGGFGEAHHTLIAGQNGSGKTVAALSVLAAKLVAHPAMGCLIPDTAGDITNDSSYSKGEEYQFSFHDLLRRGGREPIVIGIEQVRLESKYAFAELITGFLKEWFSLEKEKAVVLAKRIPELLEADGIKLKDLSLEQFLEYARTEVPFIYASKKDKQGNRVSDSGDAKANEMDRVLNNPGLLNRYRRDWDHKFGALFQRGKFTVKHLLNLFLNESKIVILSIGGLSESSQTFVMLEIFKNLKWIVDDRFKRRNEMVNALVVLDEAPRWVPQFDEAPVSEHILDAIRTTRKQGLGWTFISQRLASIHKDILSESHTKWFGRNLGTGADAAHLLEALGKAGMQVYESLSHQGGYYWLIVGLDVNLGVGKTFMSLVTPGGNATEAIIAANPHIWR